MSIQINRRQWLKKSALAVAGLSIACNTEALDKLEALDSQNQAGSNIILLDQNENPFGISKKTREAIMENIGFSHRYPDNQMTNLKKLISEKEDVEPENIVLGAGATEIFRLAGLIYGLDGGEIISADPTYSGFISYMRKIDGKLKTVRVDEDYKHDLAAMEKAITKDTKMIYVVNPNNPVGTIVEKSKLRSFCRDVSRRVPVFVDEAYHELVEDPDYSSMVDLVGKGDNVIIARTFSKIFGLAGLRVGYGIAKPEIIKKFTRIQTNFAPISVLSLSAAIAAYKDTGYIDFCRTKNIEARSQLYEILTKLGYFYVPSHTNFVPFRISRKGKDFVADVLKHNIQIRTFGFHNEQWIRISIGTPDEITALGSALEKVS